MSDTTQLEMTPEARSFVQKWGLKDVRQVGSALRLSPSDYWKFIAVWLAAVDLENLADMRH